MSGQKGNKKHASSTSYPNQKNNKKNPAIVLRKFKEMIANSKEDENILCFQDACASIEWRDSKVNYWCSIIPIFATLKTDIQNIIVSRINRGALKGDFNPTASIWREKQLGERDQQEIKQTNTNLDVKLTDEQIKKISDNIDNNI